MLAHFSSNKKSFCFSVFAVQILGINNHSEIISCLCNIVHLSCLLVNALQKFNKMYGIAYFIDYSSPQNCCASELYTCK